MVLGTLRSIGRSKAVKLLFLLLLLLMLMVNVWPVLLVRWSLCCSSLVTNPTTATAALVMVAELLVPPEVVHGYYPQGQ